MHSWLVVLADVAAGLRMASLCPASRHFSADPRNIKKRSALEAQSIQTPATIATSIDTWRAPPAGTTIPGHLRLPSKGFPAGPVSLKLACCKFTACLPRLFTYSTARTAARAHQSQLAGKRCSCLALCVPWSGPVSCIHLCLLPLIDWTMGQTDRGPAVPGCIHGAG